MKGIRRRFMNSKNKYNNFTSGIEIRNRNNNNELNKENKLNTFIDNSNTIILLFYFLD